MVDSSDKLGRAVSQNTGEKTSALEVTERLREAAAKGQAAGSPSKEDHSKKAARTGQGAHQAIRNRYLISARLSLDAGHSPGNLAHIDFG